MDLLQRELVRKRDAIAALNDGPRPAKRFLSRRERDLLEQQQQQQQAAAAEVVAAQQRVDAGAAADAATATTTEPLRLPTSSSSPPPPASRSTRDDATSQRVLSGGELARSLRSLGVPIMFFAENDADRTARLRKLQLHAHDRAHGSAAGKHDNLQRTIEQEIDAEIQAASASRGGANHSSDHQQNRDKEEVQPIERYRAQKTREQFEHVADYIHYFFKRLLLLWEEQLNDRPIEEKRSVAGKKSAATQKQTRLYIKPFFKLLRKRDVPPDILRDVTIIADLGLAREYVKANDHYLRMSIGNAPWPMGVTMVGIHERKGREKIFSQSIAHVLNDENQRKYIQSMKRLLTWAQTAFPNPSNTKNVG